MILWPLRHVALPIDSLFLSKLKVVSIRSIYMGSSEVKSLQDAQNVPLSLFVLSFFPNAMNKQKQPCEAMPT
jgi:hypothetical protein